jgi:hypothetical protein
MVVKYIHMNEKFAKYLEGKWPRPNRGIVPPFPWMVRRKPQTTSARKIGFFCRYLKLTYLLGPLDPEDEGI